MARKRYNPEEIVGKLADRTNRWGPVSQVFELPWSIDESSVLLAVER